MKTKIEAKEKHQYFRHSHFRVTEEFLKIYIIYTRSECKWLTCLSAISIYRIYFDYTVTECCIILHVT
jgi:hypothetical protein